MQRAARFSATFSTEISADRLGGPPADRGGTTEKINGSHKRHTDTGRSGKQLIGYPSELRAAGTPRSEMCSGSIDGTACFRSTLESHSPSTVPLRGKLRIPTRFRSGVLLRLALPFHFRPPPAEADSIIIFITIIITLIIIIPVVLVLLAVMVVIDKVKEAKIVHNDTSTWIVWSNAWVNEKEGSESKYGLTTVMLLDARDENQNCML
uniref:Uncharacterized protein n=1 Tax=Anopheles farauti TaxID=69004 RepID=A0A182QZY4_9DIPT